MQIKILQRLQNKVIFCILLLGSLLNIYWLMIKDHETKPMPDFVVNSSQRNIISNDNNQQANTQFYNSCNKIHLPKNVALVSAVRHTSTLGTIDNPTIDGGIINSVDGLPVYHSPVIQSLHIIPNGNQSHSGDNSSRTFNDDWATSNKLKVVLEHAAQTGKLGYVLQQSSDKGLPASTALVPVVESAYQDNAISPKGAAGSWQLMPKTALDLGIEPQERTAFVPATNAALDYLNQLHNQFGNWELAYAAYNAGSQRVNEALAKNPTATSINDLDLPQETKNYVYKLMQINQMLDN